MQKVVPELIASARTAGALEDIVGSSAGRNRHGGEIALLRLVAGKLR